MDRRSVITSLRALRVRMEIEDPDISLVDDMSEAALMLSDVCHALGLSQSEIALVLGQETAEAVEEWAGARLWQPVGEKETAAVPTPELAAVPV